MPDAGLRPLNFTRKGCMPKPPARIQSPSLRRHVVLAALVFAGAGCILCWIRPTLAIASLVTALLLLLISRFLPRAPDTR